MSLKQYVIDSVKPDDYYSKRFPHWNPHVRGNVSCAFHDDRTPSLAISLKNGGARCHAASCQASLGNIVHFESRLKNIPEKIAARRIFGEFVRPIIPSKTLLLHKESLYENTHYILKIKKEMGLNLSSIRKFRLGLDADSHRITIPIISPFGFCVNLRFYRLPSERTAKDEAKLFNVKGHGRLDLFPQTVLEASSVDVPLYFMASEKEAMLAIQDGYTAFTTTAGEGSWDTTWNPYFEGRTVFLVFDRDEGGELATRRIVTALAGVARSVTPITLPFRNNRKDWKDYADWRLREKHRPDELGAISKRIGDRQSQRNSNRTGKRDSSKQIKQSKQLTPKLPDYASDELLDISSISSRADLLNLRIHTHGIVAAKSPNTYSIPWRFEVMAKNRAPFFFELPIGRELLRLVRASDLTVLALIRTLVGSPSADVKPTDFITATEVEIIPTAVLDRDVPYVVQRCYYFGARIEANIPYEMDIIPTSEIRSQETIGIITKITPLAKTIDKFELTPETFANLSLLQPEGEGVWNKLVTVANDVAQKYTRIYNRLDWHIVALLTWCSPIGWRFPGEPELQRGWLNSLALGDTETGKSKVSKALQGIFNCGVFVNAENCTYVGLVGGAIKMGSGQLMLRWGRIPLSDRQLVVLEEMSGLSVAEISNMSDVRSSGVARLDKGGINAETNSRTRLLFLSNVRNPRKNLSGYLFGVHAIQELVGHGEDIARFDLITTLIDREVSIDIINANRLAVTAKTEESIPSDVLRELCHFIWSLNPDQIHFTPDAYDECLTQTKKLSATYHSAIPVFKGGSGRYKLGRLAASIACLQFAWDSDNRRISITAEHVKAAAKLLRFIYDKPSFGYRQYSEQMFDREKVKDAKLLRRAFEEALPTASLAKVLETLIHSTQFTRDELQAIGSLSSLHADRLIGVMVRERALRKGIANVWEITPAGKLFMEKMMVRYAR